MSIEKQTMAARYDDEVVQFVELLAKNADGGYGVKKAQILNRGWLFLRALYMISEDAVNFSCLQSLQRLHGLPVSGANGPGLASEDGNPKQARLNLFSRHKAVAGMGLAYKSPFFNALGPTNFITRRICNG